MARSLAAGDLRAPALLLAVAFAAHNLEEAIAFPRMRTAIAARARDLGLPWWSPAPAVSTTVLLAITLAGVVAMLWAGRRPPNARRRFAVRTLAWILLANVLAPHVPAALVLGGYTPGLLTALAVNTPLSLWILLRAAR